MIRTESKFNLHKRRKIYRRSLPFPIGTRVQLSELGQRRSPKSPRTGTVVGYSSGSAVRVKLDGRAAEVALHASYLDELRAPEV